MSAKVKKSGTKRKKAYKPLTERQARDLVRAVRDWLSFQRLCKRDMIFSERSLSQPIAEYLLATHKGRIVPEFNHPGFVPDGPGRPKQVDFALTRSRGDNVQAVIETKWIGETTYSKQAIVDDILRLECFRNKSAHASRYFLVAGLTKNFTRHFQDLEYNDGGRWQFTTSLLEFQDTAPSTVEVRDADPALRKYFASFRTRYKADLPERFKTTLLKGLDVQNVSVYLWKLGSNRKRAVIKFKDDWP